LSALTSSDAFYTCPSGKATSLGKEVLDFIRALVDLAVDLIDPRLHCRCELIARQL